MCKKIYVNNVLYLVQVDSRTNTVCVTRCHPYDRQEYHWARIHPVSEDWIIYRNGKPVSCKRGSVTVEKIAEILHNLDGSLKPIMCHN